MLTVNDKKFDWENIPLADCLFGNAMDTNFTLKIFHLLEGKLKEQGCWDVMEKLLSPTLPAFADMEFGGLDVAPEELGIVGRSLDRQQMMAEDDLLMHPKVFKGANVQSTVDLRAILFTDEQGFALYPPKRTGKGEPSTDKATLDMLKDFLNEELEEREKKLKKGKK
jgi:DNA polymerase I-like protein with 3'-5' exonuclease and polymerase domains